MPSTTPIHLGTTYFYDSAATLDRVFGHEEEGYSYARYNNPTTDALEELTTELDEGHGSLACASGMAALQVAITGRADRSAPSDCGRAIRSTARPSGCSTRFLRRLALKRSYVDICDLDAVEKAIAEKKPGCVFMESISNPILRVGAIDKIAELSRKRPAPRWWSTAHSPRRC